MAPHRRPRTFDRYGHLFPALEEAVTERMEAAYRAALDVARKPEPEGGDVRPN